MNKESSQFKTKQTSIYLSKQIYMVYASGQAQHLYIHILIYTPLRNIIFFDRRGKVYPEVIGGDIDRIIRNIRWKNCFASLRLQSLRS